MNSEPRLFRISTDIQGKRTGCEFSATEAFRAGKNELVDAIDFAKTTLKAPPDDFVVEEWDEEDQTWYVMVVNGEPIFHNLLD